MSKQGRADTKGPHDRKVEPSPRAINPGATSYIGTSLGDHVTEKGTIKTNFTPMDAGRGYRAPGIGATTHKSGSQGKH